MTVSTVGHSTHPIEEFISILQAHGIRRLVDVRTIPKSRRNPQFSQENLPASLHAAGIEYFHLPGLGGLRHARKDDVLLFVFEIVTFVVKPPARCSLRRPRRLAALDPDPA